MPRVLRIINRFNLGGPTYNAAYLTKYLAPEFETLLVGGEKDESEDSSEFILENLGLKPIIIKEMRRDIDLKKDYEAYKKIVAIIKEFKPDIVHTHASKAGTIGRLAANNQNVPVVLHTFHGHVFHSYFGKVKTLFYKNIERNLARNTTRIIAISEKQKAELSLVHRICNPDKIQVIPLGFDLNRFRENMEEKRYFFRKQYKLDANELAIGIIGRLVPVKNHKLFLEAIAILAQKSLSNVRFFIIGDGESRLLIEHQARELGIDHCDWTLEKRKSLLTFTSWIKEVDYALAGLDIVALTSLNEGTPVSLIEAQAAGKPIVSTNVGGIENAIAPNKTALLVEGTQNAQAFASALQKLIENKELRETFSGNGWLHVEKKYHYTRLIDDTRQLYYQLLEKNVRVPA